MDITLGRSFDGHCRILQIWKSGRLSEREERRFYCFQGRFPQLIPTLYLHLFLLSEYFLVIKRERRVDNRGQRTAGQGV